MIFNFLKKKSPKIVALKKAIKSGKYDWGKAVADTADKILNYPQALLWK